MKSIILKKLKYLSISALFIFSNSISFAQSFPNNEIDHLNMMTQLKIKKLRPGPSGDENAPNHANIDESFANPFPNYPDALTFKNNKTVNTADEWWKLRRPESIEDFEREVYGRIPQIVPNVSWKITAEEREYIGWKPVLAQEIRGIVDNGSYTDISVNIEGMLLTPIGINKPVPVLIMFGPAKFPSPMQPNENELNKINAAFKAQLIEKDPSLKDVFTRLPGYQPIPQQPFANVDERVQQLLAAGWGVLLLNPSSIQADNGAGLTKGIIGLVNKGQYRKPDDWGALRAWGWGASRAFDFLSTVPNIDANYIGIEGVSRYGKAALVTMAFDQRFYMALVGSSGEGGAKPHRRNFGEAVESLTGSGEYHWMAGNFLKYGTEESAFGSKNANDIPVESNQLIALCAPRLTFISYGVPEKGDAKWLDQQGSYMATVAAGSVWKLLGANDLGVGNDYKNAKMPPVLKGQLDGQLAWQQHDGGHTDAPNMKTFIEWANKNMNRK